MCADGWNNRPFTKLIQECPDCGHETDEEGDALYGCNYSSVDCLTCGSRPCDGAC